MTPFMTVFQADEESVATLWKSVHLKPLKIKAHKPSSHKTTPDAKNTVISKGYRASVAAPKVLPCCSCFPLCSRYQALFSTIPSFGLPCFQAEQKVPSTLFMVALNWHAVQQLCLIVFGTGL